LGFSIAGLEDDGIPLGIVEQELAPALDRSSVSIGLLEASVFCWVGAAYAEQKTLPESSIIEALA
jgi:hypothetical protein